MKKTFYYLKCTEITLTNFMFCLKDKRLYDSSNVKKCRNYCCDSNFYRFFNVSSYYDSIPISTYYIKSYIAKSKMY